MPPYRRCSNPPPGSPAEEELHPAFCPRSGCRNKTEGGFLLKAPKESAGGRITAWESGPPWLCTGDPDNAFPNETSNAPFPPSLKFPALRHTDRLPGPRRWCRRSRTVSGLPHPGLLKRRYGKPLWHLRRKGPARILSAASSLYLRILS